MFGPYFHSLTCHAPLLYRIVCLRSLNTEMQECMFGQCNLSQEVHPINTQTIVIPNIRIRIQEEQKTIPPHLQI